MNPAEHSAPEDLSDAEAFHTPEEVREDRDRDDEWGAWLARGETPLLWGYEGET